MCLLSPSYTAPPDNRISSPTVERIRISFIVLQSASAPRFFAAASDGPFQVRRMCGQTSNCSVLKVLTHLSTRGNGKNHFEWWWFYCDSTDVSYQYTFDYDDSTNQRLLQLKIWKITLLRLWRNRPSSNLKLWLLLKVCLNLWSNKWLVYKSTIESDTGLRDILVNPCASDLETPARHTP